MLDLMDLPMWDLRDCVGSVGLALWDFSYGGMSVGLCEICWTVWDL